MPPWQGAWSTLKTKKALRETQTLRAGCGKAEPNKISPRRRPHPGGAGRPKFNQLEMVTTFTYTNPVWWRSMHAISSYRGNKPTNKHPQTHTHKPTDRTDYNTLHRSFASAQCNNVLSSSLVAMQNLLAISHSAMGVCSRRTRVPPFWGEEGRWVLRCKIVYMIEYRLFNCVRYCNVSFFNVLYWCVTAVL